MRMFTRNFSDRLLPYVLLKNHQQNAENKDGSEHQYIKYAIYLRVGFVVGVPVLYFL